MTWTPASKVGDTDVDIPAAKQKLAGNSYGKPIGSDRSNVYTAEFAAALTQYGINVNVQVDAGKRPGPRVTEGGVFDWTVKDQMDIGKYASAPLPEFRNIWMYTAPGSGAPGWIGPSFEVGKWCQDVLRINHQWIGYPIGGYMGLMGGDPGLSYNEVIAALGAELERLLDVNPHVQKALADVLAGRPTDIEFWFSAYSQSADGMEDALERLFGDGGKYAPLRSRINGTLMFGNPSRQKGEGPAPGWGISRKIRQSWLRAVTTSITATSPGKPDFYAACDDEIRPLFYFEVVKAETSLSFFGHIVKLAIPILVNAVSPLLGGVGGGLITSLLSSKSGLPLTLTAQAVAAADGDGDPTDEQVHAKLMDLFTLRGIVTNIPALFRLLGSLSGIMTHGEYHLPKAEFGGRTGIQVACDIVASFRRH